MNPTASLKMSTLLSQEDSISPSGARSMGEKGANQSVLAPKEFENSQVLGRQLLGVTIGFRWEGKPCFCQMFCSL